MKGPSSVSRGNLRRPRGGRASLPRPARPSLGATWRDQKPSPIILKWRAWARPPETELAMGERETSGSEVSRSPEGRDLNVGGGRHAGAAHRSVRCVNHTRASSGTIGPRVRRAAGCSSDRTSRSQLGQFCRVGVRTGNWVDSEDVIADHWLDGSSAWSPKSSSTRLVCMIKSSGQLP